MTIEQKIAFIENYKKSKNAASGSKYDANANVTDKNIASLAWEVPKKDNIDLNREMMIRKLDEKYGDGYSKKYIADLNSHIIYKHDETSLIHPYCCSISMYPFLLEGLQSLGGTSGVPKSTSSFCGSFINLSFLISSQFAGALATPEFLTYLDYFLRKDYGDDYYKRPDAVIELGSRTRTIEQKVTDYFQQIVYSINQPAAARGYQSIFWNIAYFDKYYFESIFEGFYFPDGDQPKWNSVSWLQKKFMKWFNKERTKAVLTFPVETLNLLTDENGYRDKEWADFAAEMLAEGHSFFIYRSNSVDALASCCFSKDQKVLTRSSSGGVYLSTFKEIYDAKWRDKKCNFKIFHNGSWVEGKVVRFKSKNMFEVITMNNKKLIVSEDHLNCTIDGNKRTDELTTNDYLLMNSIKLDAVPEQDLKLTYEQGYLIGLYAGDGSKSKKTNEVVFSLNEEKNRKSIELLEKALKDLNENERIFRESMYGNLLSVRISSKKVKDFISEWVFGDSADTKEINLNCLTQSSEFRQGIINGMYDSDGGNNNRIYSCSEKLIESLEVIFSSLGYNTIINEEDRRDEKVIINNEEFNRNFISRCIRWYESKNRRSMADVYITKNNSTYFKIKSITPVEYEDEFMYCFEMKNQDEPYFTLPNNIITHNCRLRNAVEENTFSYTLGAGAIQTGSKGVITMNLNRIVQDWYRETEDKTMTSLSNYLTEIVKRIHVYLSAFNDIIWDDYNAGLLTVFKAGFIDLDKQYLTLGINGFVEAAEFLKIKIDPNNEEYKLFSKTILKTISDLNKQAKTEHCKFNTEFVPAESLGAKNAHWDEQDGYEVPRPLYNSYFYKVEDENADPLKKFRYHGKDFTGYCDGGSALHCNLEEHLSQKHYRMLMDVAVQEDTPYFTFNVPNTVCNDCGFISKHNLKKCPHCGSENLDYLTRVIGYLKRISNFSQPRQEEANKRFYA